MLSSKPSTSGSNSMDQSSEQHQGEALGPDSSSSNSSDSNTQSNGALLSSQRPCRSCGGTGQVVCPVCDASGIQLIEL